MLSAIHTQSNTPHPSPAEEVRMTAGTVDRVDTNVYIGGYLAAANPEIIRQIGVSRIVKMFEDTDAYHGGYHRHKGVRYLVLPASDAPGYDIRADAEAAIRFIQEGIAGGERVLVHCHAGISRSATVVLLHLMINRGMPLDLAVARLKLVRPFVCPNAGFMAHLRATDARLQRLRVGDEQRYVAPAYHGDHDSALPLRLARDDAPRGEPYPRPPI